jgi:prepilin-type N-terminal cleavage/methylation domain-containing protein
MKTTSILGRVAKRGFTLVEMLVVIVILATLVSLGAIGVAKTMRGAETTKRSAFTRTVLSAIAAYKAEMEEFPFPNDNSATSYGTVSNNRADVSNAEVMMTLLGRSANGKRDANKRAYITDSSMLYVCEGKRVTKLDDILANGSISSSAMIGFPIKMVKTGVSKYKDMSEARAFAPIQIKFDVELDDCQVTIPGDGAFSSVIKLN